MNMTNRFLFAFLVVLSQFAAGCSDDKVVIPEKAVELRESDQPLGAPQVPVNK